MNIAFVTAEVSPFAKTGGLGDVSGALPKALAELGHDVAVFTPFYREARQHFAKAGREPEVIVDRLELTWDSWQYDIRILASTLPRSAVPIYFFENDYLYNRESIYAYRWDGVDDQLERYAVLCRAAIRTCELLSIRPDIFHSHDWHTAALPIYLHSGLRAVENFTGTASVFTIHNLNYQGRAPASHFYALGLHERYGREDALDYYGSVLPMKAGIIFADEVTTVSPTYAREIQTPQFGAGLDGLLRSQAGKLTGILNGIDTREWDPATDRHIVSPYDADSLEEKIRCKETLSLEAGFHFDPDRPLLGVVSRLVGQKGFDVLLPMVASILASGAQMVLLGSGETDLENGFRQLSHRYPHHFRAWIQFDNALAHRITAGCDIFVMPSRYEPCGLNQMYALRYGTLPLVHMTGGLADTVVPLHGDNLDTANGFGFWELEPEHLFDTIEHAMHWFGNQEVWSQMQRNGMERDFSWASSARRYEEVYRRALASR
ncbi:MAG: glycogen synthase GlgA [Acidobacteriota bacterium]